MENEKIKVFFPTNNIGKFDRYKYSMEQKGIDYNRYLTIDGKECKVEVEENGKTTKENAEKKAKGFYAEYKKRMPNQKIFVMTTDESLYINGLKEDEQPGMFVRRFKGLDSRATDEEVVKHYTNIVKELGGKVKAKWHYSLVAYDGEKFSYLEWDEPVTFIGTPVYPITPGYVLNNITETNIKDENENIKLLSELTEDERNEYLAPFTDQVADLIK